jgi:hypothetical protein
MYRTNKPSVATEILLRGGRNLFKNRNQRGKENTAILQSEVQIHLKKKLRLFARERRMLVYFQTLKLNRD